MLSFEDDGVIGVTTYNNGELEGEYQATLPQGSYETGIYGIGTEKAISSATVIYPPGKVIHKYYEYGKLVRTVERSIK